jgi:hypothetical protein
MIRDAKKKFDEDRAESLAIEAAVRAGVREALLMHKRLGNPIAVWENERVVWIAPEDIQVDEPGESTASSSS